MLFFIPISGGDMFPGDIVVLTSNSLLVSQSALTGKVLPMEKNPYSKSSPSKISSSSDPLSSTIGLAGTSVITGSGHALVVVTGDNTYLASIAEVAQKCFPERYPQRFVSFVGIHDDHSGARHQRDYY
jgi:P-type Mg2+ transporter